MSVWVHRSWGIRKSDATEVEKPFQRQEKKERRKEKKKEIEAETFRYRNSASFSSENLNIIDIISKGKTKSPEDV